MASADGVGKASDESSPPLFVYTGAHGHIWSIGPGAGSPTKITEGDEDNPAWSPKGDRVAFTSTQPDGKVQISIVNADGTDMRPLTHIDNIYSRQLSWSPDGQEIAFSVGDHPLSPTKIGISAVNVATAQVRTVHEQAGVDILSPTWSPDGKKIAFERRSRGSGSSQIWQVNTDGSRMESPVAGSNSSDFHDPEWSPDGKEIVFSGSDGGVKGIVVKVLGRDGLREVIHDPVYGSGGYFSSEPTWSPTGARIIYQRSYGLNRPPEIYVVNAANGSGQQLIVEGKNATGWRGSQLAQLIYTKDRNGIQKLLSSLSITEINDEVATLPQFYRDRLADVVLDFHAFSLPEQRRRDQLLAAMRAALEKHQLGFYAEVWSYTRFETRLGGGAETYCNPGRVVLGLDEFGKVAPTFRNTVLHESFHSFNCHENGPVDALNEGAAIWVFKETFGSTDQLAQNWAEATYGTKLRYRDLRGQPNYRLEAPENPTSKLVEEYDYLRKFDPTLLAWQSTETLKTCYQRYWEHINYAQPWDSYLREAQVATDQMLADPKCSQS